ncbi:hypothetical protein CRUP_018933 [Coryphaenoides rupestris]|nr:hypothetical protein CRUP_018933 [Coryphaenoides rupestris]
MGDLTSMARFLCYRVSLCHNTTETVNHAILAVGYGAEEDGGMPCWIVKNSWGPAWGMDITRAAQAKNKKAEHQGR